MKNMLNFTNHTLMVHFLILQMQQPFCSMDSTYVLYDPFSFACLFF